MKFTWQDTIIGFLVGVIISVLFITGNFNLLDNLVVDNFFRLRPPFTEDKRIVIVAVDDTTLSSENLGQWSSWTRDNYIKLLEIINKGAPKVIGFNIILSEPSKEKEQDNKLAKIVSTYNNVVMPIIYIYSNPPISLLPYSLFAKSAYSVGHSGSLQDIDGITREIEPEIKIENNDYWAFPIEIVRKYLNINSSNIFEKDNNLFIGKLKIPLVAKNRLAVNFLGEPNTFQYLPYHKVIANKYSPSVFKNKIVLIGVNSLGLGDYVITPFSARTPMAGIEMHANIINNILEQDTLKALPTLWNIVMVIILSTVFGVVFLNIYSIFRKTLFTLFSLISITTAGYVLFLFDYKISEISLNLCVILSFLAIVLYEGYRANISLNKEIFNIASFYKSPETLDLAERVKRAIYTIRCLTKADYVCYRKLDKNSDILAAIVCNDTVLTTSASAEGKNILASLPEEAIDTRDIPNELNNIPMVKDSRYVLFKPLKTGDKYTGLLEFYYSSSPHILEIYEKLANELALLLTQKTSSFIPNLNIPILNPESKISTLMDLNQKVREDREFFEAILLNSYTPIFVCNSLGFIMFYNPQLLKCCEIEDSKDIKNQNIISVLENVFPSISDKWSDIWNAVVLKQSKIETFLQDAAIAYNLGLTPVKNNDNRVIGVVGILTDITDLLNKATTDSLTNLYNKRYFQELSWQEFNKSKRIKEYGFSLMLIDIDHFKFFNDFYGHQMGDKVLKMIGDIIISNLRKTDIKGRYGGDEFIVILPDTNIKGALVVAEKLKASLANHELLDNKDNVIEKVTFSIGISCYEDDDKSIENIIERSDQALYLCKKAERNCIKVNAKE